ncbi:fumarylacetoacetate hydrolase family protein [Ramlibacter sp. AN1015]|uniref:fumarylacetoacetate hydrolase family protein n=1 Tax=Ramlibacter sp. AN1015 TaxID=3133428 RepID=UPI0030BEB5EA
MKTVVGCLLNFRGAWEAMEPAMHREPHFRPPVHPVLYLKPANTWRASGDTIVLPTGVDEVEVGATLGVVIGAPASRVREQDALRFVAGYVAVNDLTVPHTAVLRPPIKQKCRDGFCPMGPMAPAGRLANPDALELRAFVNGERKMTHNTAHLLRPVARLLAEVTEFMTLEAGDVLLMGVPENAPRARAGDRVAVEIEGVGRVENTLRAQGAVL